MNRTSLPALAALNRDIATCAQCPGLRRYCRRVARVKRRAYSEECYHGRPVINLLPERSAASVYLLIVGLAPGAHGANRTGRMFTGDRSGDFLYRALHQEGFASQPTSQSWGDGLQLRRAIITAACHCAPPDNKPAPTDLARCAPFLEQTIDLMPDLRVVVCLGKLAFDAVMKVYRGRGWLDGRGDRGRRSSSPPARGGAGGGLRLRTKDVSGHPTPRFAHAAEFSFAPPVPAILCSYHPSQQNTFTGRLTAPMLGDVFQRAREYADSAHLAPRPRRGG